MLGARQRHPTPVGPRDRGPLGGNLRLLTGSGPPTAKSGLDQGQPFRSHRFHVGSSPPRQIDGQPTATTIDIRPVENEHSPRFHWFCLAGETMFHSGTGNALEGAVMATFPVPNRPYGILIRIALLIQRPAT
ncbi:hypothetical protein Asi03nite_68980 [Actinoplanes siamensis]|uniref:Uncharacterized protein n=1 Tax=Actinoplanes siamensis TaxID=1223317 RepID=A0A919NF04_9ACTN|nr:hypothetical protein Asi03nite_68980 [Actinoplanes siamensis]